MGVGIGIEWGRDGVLGSGVLGAEDNRYRISDIGRRFVAARLRLRRFCFLGKKRKRLITEVAEERARRSRRDGSERGRVDDGGGRPHP